MQMKPREAEQYIAQFAAVGFISTDIYIYKAVPSQSSR